MKIIKKFSPNEKDLKESTAPTKLMTDFPQIYQERNSEALAKLVADYAKESGIRMDTEAPAAAEVTLQVRRKRTASDASSEASGAQTKKSRKDKSEASATDNTFAPIPKRKRGKGEAPPVNSQERLAEGREERAKRMKAFKEKYETPGVVMTPEEAKEAQKQIEEMLAERRKEKGALKASRDEKLQSIGLDGSDEYFMKKLVEVKQIADSVEQFAVKEATEMLEKISEASEADGFVAAQESASVAEVSEASAQVIQTSSLPLIISTHKSPSNDSNLDDIPIGQRMGKLHKPSSQPQKPLQTTPQLPLQAEQSSAAAECTEDPEDPPTSDLPQCDSPSNLFSLERHLGGEITKTPQKATKSVPKQIDLVNKQPEQSHQTSPKQTSTSTPTPTQPETQNTPQKAFPEPVVETVVPESVQATESEQTVAITVSEPIQTPTQPPSTAITNDQPSSSSSIIQTQQQPPPNLLKSEFLEVELMEINAEVQRLMQLRRSPTLKLTYQEQWETLQTRASELLSTLSQKCIKVHNAASMHYASLVHLVEDQDPLYIAITPYFPELEYLTREARLFKLLRQTIVKQQEAAKARKDLLLQK